MKIERIQMLHMQRVYNTLFIHRYQAMQNVATKLRCTVHHVEARATALLNAVEQLKKQKIKQDPGL